MLIDSILEANAQGWGTFPTNKKIPPKDIAWKTREPTAFIDESEYREEYAIVLRPEDLIIDVDPRNFPKGRNMWKEFMAAHGLDGLDRSTYVVKTGGGGYHIYLRKPIDVLVRKNFTEWPGLDFLCGDKGAYIIGPGSAHASGNFYTKLRGDISAIAAAPESLLSVISKGKKDEDKTEQKPDLSFSNDSQNIARYTEYLETSAPVAVEGNAGDQTTFKAACRGRDYRLSPDKTLELMLAFYNPRCLPPWNEDELKTKVYNAYKYNAEPVGKRDPETVFEKAVTAANDVDKRVTGVVWEYDPDVRKRDWKMGADGNPRPSINNAVGYLSTCPDIEGNVRYSELSHDIEITGELPWHSRRIGKHWTDEDTTHLMYYMSTSVKTEFPDKVVRGAIYLVAARKMYHPVREYLNGLKWDGIKRLDNWLTTYCGVQKDDYSQAIGRKTLVAAVTRVYKPGCKFDHVLVLEGAQGIGKSRAVAALGGAWFSDFHIDPANKDTVDAMRGKWIIEIPEMEALRGGKDMQLLKAFITKTEDRVRLAYARSTIDLPRRGIFIGTFNPDNIGYLTDSTGNRRFWPVLCLKRIDVAALTRDRDQIFAEAKVAYENGEPLFLTDEKIRNEAEAQADDRVEVDPWVEVIEHWSFNAGKDVKEVSTADVYEQVLHGAVKNISRRDQIRIGKALALAHWDKKRTAHGFIYYRGSKYSPVAEDTIPVPADVFEVTFT
jgi:predicted P-loop ATPase